ncbi:uncharacterized protein LOC111710999 isoform X2 [Eurytemora carolleeae]|uniref:uncharacterized protein LOC111710999 isoform X2 n=1 Tax=Eurytemora carolleeae TaxID=1294199 RepID=UPI000C77EE62|nr:uncharacterized protein LOC111710999 isoform X2 [Eurytemora carolleeae]|eukprot:XP_023340983.1 uncharacterized protein LOC111710999 isoform X2 [Eurytemora affinis]
MVQGRIILFLLPAAVYLEKEYLTLDLEVEDVLLLQNDCELKGIKDKLNKTNTLFWRAVDKTRNLPHNINLIIPPGFCQDQNYNRTRRVQGSAFITSSPSSIVQPGACGEPGYQLNLGFTNTRRNRQLNENLENMVYLTRFLYGVFPEHGVESSSMFPLFYRNRSENCLDRIEENQINVTSSLLFSTDINKFENMERYCTRTTHVQSSPTLQNLICSEKSVMEVLDFKDQVELLAPVINILQREEINAFFFILDTGAEIRRVWSVFRAGLAPSYKTLPDSTKLTVRYSVSDPMNITDVQKQNLTEDFIKTKVFPESLLGFPDQPLAGVHLLYQNMDLIEQIGFPNIIIVTASSESYLETEYKQVSSKDTDTRNYIY